MTHAILFIHGAGSDAYAADAKLVASLQEALGPDYIITFPQMPESGNPSYKVWKKQIAHELSALKGPVILVGHSLGGSVLLKYVTENTLQQPIEGLFLAEIPYWGEEGWQQESYALQPDAAAHLPANVPLYLYQSHDDEIVDYEHVELYKRDLPQATVRAFKGRNHQLNNDLSEMATDIRALS